MTKNDPKSLAELWDICIPFLYGQDYILGLERTLKKRGVKKILDSSCGTGFPAYELSNNGFELVCTDGDRVMLKKAREKMQNKKVDVIHSKWQNLSNKFSEQFDCVLCRGNSLVYVDSWGKNKINSKKARKNIAISLKNFYKVLRPGGICYIDTISKKEFQTPTGNFCERYGIRKIGDKRYSLVWIMKHNKRKKVRSWLPQLMEWNNNTIVKKTNFSIKSYLLQHEELLELLKEAGFSTIQKYVKIGGENNYDVFLAYKPAKRGETHENIS